MLHCTRVLASRFALAATLLPAAPALAAQDTVPARPPAGVCFRGAPAERCTWFTLTEAGVHYRLTDLVPDDERVLFNGALGFMVNTSRRTALGGAVFIGVEGDARGGLALRGRRWLGGRTSLDLALGVHLAGDATSGRVRPGSPTFQASLKDGDLIGVSARLDVLRIRSGCIEPACFPRTSWTSGRFYLGGELGSGLGVASALVAGVGVVIFALSYGS